MHAGGNEPLLRAVCAVAGGLSGRLSLAADGPQPHHLGTARLETHLLPQSQQQEQEQSVSVSGITAACLCAVCICVSQDLSEALGSPFSRGLLSNCAIYCRPVLPACLAAIHKFGAEGPQGEIWWKPGGPLLSLSYASVPFLSICCLLLAASVSHALLLSPHLSL